MHAQKFGARVGYLAALLQFVAFGLYGQGLFDGSIHTNPVSWWMWGVETLVGLVIYADRTQDASKWAAEAASLLGVLGVNLYLGYRMLSGDIAAVLEPVALLDLVSTILAGIAFWFWLASRKRLGPEPALLVFQFALLAAAFPLIRSAYVDPSAEPLWPWVLWSISFGLQLLCTTIRWDGWMPLLNPANYLATHAIVAAIIWYGAAA